MVGDDLDGRRRGRKDEELVSKHQMIQPRCGGIRDITHHAGPRQPKMSRETKLSGGVIVDREPTDPASRIENQTI